MTKQYECPCKTCTTETGRCVGCHADCIAYKEWRKIIDSDNRVRQEQQRFAVYNTKFNY
jgi:hypothetical protein